MDATRRRDHNYIRILQNPLDTDTPNPKRYRNRTRQSSYRRWISSNRTRRLLVELLPVLVILCIPVAVQAGLFSSFSNLFSTPVDAATASTTVDTTASFTPLLSADHNPDPMNAVGGGDVTVADGALVSTGPVGADEIAAARAKSAKGQISVYVVRNGDSLSQIAQMYGVTTKTILWANDLQKASDIHPGDSLVILPIAGIQHTVVAGETLASIVKKYGADLNEVVSYNNLQATNTVTVGDVLIIPDGELQTASVAKTTAAATPTKSSGTPQVSGSVKVGHVAESTNGWLINPVPGAIKTQGIHGYNAVDLAISVGTHVRAAAAGQVIVSKDSGWNGGYGQYIVIKHNNGVQTLYAHLSKNVVSAGDWVTAGEYIGAVGMTGKSTGPHLHFEVRGGVNPF